MEMTRIQIRITHIQIKTALIVALFTVVYKEAI